jgi:hypothetical protein
MNPEDLLFALREALEKAGIPGDVWCTPLDDNKSFMIEAAETRRRISIRIREGVLIAWAVVTPTEAAYGTSTDFDLPRVVRIFGA